MEPISICPQLQFKALEETGHGRFAELTAWAMWSSINSLPVGGSSKVLSRSEEPGDTTPLSIAVTRSTLHPYVDLFVWWLNHKSREKWWKMITCQHHIYERVASPQQIMQISPPATLYAAKALHLQRAIAATLILQHTPSGTSTVSQQSIILKLHEIFWNIAGSRNYLITKSQNCQISIIPLNSWILHGYI